MSQGITHTGVVTFHELAPRLTRIELNLDVDPGSLIEKAARGMRHVKRAVRADLHRFKAFIEMQELETGAWRGMIEDGEVVEEHDDSYDEERDYSDIEDLKDDGSETTRTTTSTRTGGEGGRQRQRRRAEAAIRPPGRAVTERRHPGAARQQADAVHAKPIDRPERRRHRAAQAGRRQIVVRLADHDTRTTPRPVRPVRR